MNGYLVQFTAYTFAMIGFIAMALFIYKKAMYSTSTSKNRDFLSVENALRLSATKTVYVIKAGSEKFLIAGDSSNTTMLAKLDNNEYSYNQEINISEIPSVKKRVQQRVSRG